MTHHADHAQESSSLRPGEQPPQRSLVTALTNVHVSDGYGMHDRLSTIVFNGSSIIDSEHAEKADEVIDGKGGALLPGLIESHAHPLTYEHLEMLSGCGVTTVMNMACQNYTLCSLLKDQKGFTDFKTAGQPAQGPGSQHAKMQNTPQSKLIWKPQQAPEYVKKVFDHDSDYLKITAEENGPNQATQNALVREAHARGKKVMTQAATYDYYRMAIESGTGGPQHIPFDRVLSNTTLDQMLAMNMFATPTMNLYRLLLPSVGDWDPEFSKNINFTKAYDVVQENVRNIYNHGIPVLAGTDSVLGSYYPVSLAFGQTLHEELQNLVDIGLSPAEALRAATIVPAKAHGLDDRGHLAPVSVGATIAS